MSKLFLLRHLESQWNKDDRFAGWVDNPLSGEGRAQAKGIADKLTGENITVIYTSPLIRNMETVLEVFKNMAGSKYPLFIHLDGGKMSRWGHFTDLSENDMPAYVSEKINERYYGALQGLNKQETTKKYGAKAHQWRRGFADKPPGGESLKDMYKRSVPFFKKHIEKDLASGKNVLLVTSGNSLRAIIKYIEKLSDKDVESVELSFGALMCYEFHNGELKRLY